MARLDRKPIHDLERIIEFDLVRATEAAALNAAQHADAQHVDAPVSQ